MVNKSSSKNVYLLGYERKLLSRRKLPTNQEVLSLLIYNYKSLGKPLDQSLKTVINEVNSVWSRTKIPLMQVRNSVEKLKNLYIKWNKIKKNSSRGQSAVQKSKENDFKLLSLKLFDIACQNKDIVLTDEQKRFLDDERTNRRRGIIPFDLEEMYSDSEESVEELSKSLSNCTLSFESRTLSSHSLQRMPSNYEDELPSSSTPRKQNILTPEMTFALDRTNVSDRDAAIIMSATVESCGVPLKTVNICPSTIRRHRIKNRKKFGENLKKNFKAPDSITLHWDGKLLPEMTGSSKVERLPVIITGLNCDQLLGVPKLHKSTGVNQTEVIFQLVQEWMLTDNVGALCFDTTSVNTGVKSGVCSLIEKKIGKSLLNLACRHHVYEIVLRCVFEIYWPVTSGPKVPKFNEFQQKWSRINKNNYKTGLDDPLVASVIKDKKDCILIFISHQLQISYATGFSGDVKLDLNPEELVFYKMQKFNFIFKRAGIKFLLGDIHQPTHIRTKSFFCICNHVLTYIEGIYQEFIKINGDAMKMREDTEKLYNQRNEIGNDIIKLSEKKEQLLEDKKKLQYKIQSAETMLTEYCLKRAERERRIKEREKDLESLKMAVEKTSSQINLLTAKQKQYLEEMITEEEYLNLKKLEEQLQTENESLANDVKNIEDVLSYDNKISDHYRSCEIAIPDSFNADLVNQHITMEIQFNEMKIRKEKLESELCLLKTSLNNERTKLLESEGCYLAANSEHDRIVKNIQQESEELTLALHKQKEQMSNSKLEASSNNSKLKNENNRYENEIRKLNEHFDKEYIEISEAESLRISKVKKQLNELEKLLSSALKID